MVKSALGLTCGEVRCATIEAAVPDVGGQEVGSPEPDTVARVVTIREYQVLTTQDILHMDTR